MYTEDERWVAGKIKKKLQKRFTVYDPYGGDKTEPSRTRGFGQDLLEMLVKTDGTVTRKDMNKAILLSSALDYYNILEAAACALVMNGRTPDEGSVFWAAVAFASGIPVVLQKNDYRQFMSTGDNSMITGLTLDHYVNTDLNEYANRTELKISEYIRKDDILPGQRLTYLSEYNYRLRSLGEHVQQYTDMHSSYSLMDVCNYFSESQELNCLLPDEDETQYEVLNIKDPGIYRNEFDSAMVYCSGPLFSPAEIREMNSIGMAVEENGLETYVPHRDGAESMISSLDYVYGLGQEAAKIDHGADKQSFELDFYYLNICPYMVVNLNGRTPDDGAVAEAGINFAMGKACALYKTDSRSFSSGQHGTIHPALQIAGHLFKTISEYKDIYNSLARQAKFTKHPAQKYRLRIHPCVVDMFLKGQDLHNMFDNLINGNPLQSHFAWETYRLSRTGLTPRSYWKPKHVYSYWPDKVTVEQEKIDHSQWPISFHTDEIRAWNQPSLINYKLINDKFPTTEPPHGIALGLNEIDMDNRWNIRICCYQKNIKHDHFQVNIDSWEDSVLYRGGCTILRMSNSSGMMCGFFTYQGTTTVNITFPKPFSTPPRVIVWLDAMELAKDTNWRVKAFATNITETGFTLELSSWSSTIPLYLGATWIAIPANNMEIYTGVFNTMEIREWNQPQLEHSKAITFPKPFSRPPKIFAGLNMIDMDCTRNMRLKTYATDIRPEGMTLHIDAWHDTRLYTAETQYIAML